MPHAFFTVNFSTYILLFFKGTISFGVGFFILIMGWPILGMIIEAYGFIVLFRFSSIWKNSVVFEYVHLFALRANYGLLCSGFWPTLAVFLQKIPVLGWLVQQPYVRSVCICELECIYLLSKSSQKYLTHSPIWRLTTSIIGIHERMKKSLLTDWLDNLDFH